jgi:hypothetical protein
MRQFTAMCIHHNPRYFFKRQGTAIISKSLPTRENV